MKCHKNRRMHELPPLAMGERAPAGDRGIGISRQQAAIAATKNVLDGGPNAEPLSKLVTNFVFGVSRQRIHERLEAVRELRRATGAILKDCMDDFEDGHYQPKRYIPEDIDHLSHISFLVSPRGYLLLADDAEATIGVWPEFHAVDLDNLRSRSRQGRDGAYDRVIRGDLAAALELLLRGSLPAHNAADLIRITANQARCYIVRTAHSKIDILQAHSKAPFGNRFAGVNQWAMVGTTVLETIVAPAGLLQRLSAAIAAGDFIGMSDDQLLAHAVNKNFLPEGEDGVDILALARTVLEKLEARGGVERCDFVTAVGAIAKASEPMSRLNRGDMKRAGFSRLDFAEHRLGLSASEGSALVALEMLRALQLVNACVAAILAGNALPVPERNAINLKPLAFAAVLLRAEGKPDRNASTFGSVVSSAGKDLDKTRGCGRLPVKSMLEKIQDPEIEARARKFLGIDPTTWFRH